MIGEHSSYPPDVVRIAAATFEVTRRILAAEHASDGVYPREPLVPPPLADTPAYSQVIADAELDDVEALVLRVLVAAELHRGVHRALRRLAADGTQPGTPVDGVVSVLDGLGVDAVAALYAMRPDGILVGAGLVESLDRGAPSLAQRVVVAQPVLDLLVTGVRPTPLQPFELEPAPDALVPVPVRGTDDDALTVIERAITSGLALAPLWIVGPTGAGRRTLLAAGAAAAGRSLVCVGQRTLARMSPVALVAAAWREVLIGHAILCVHDAEPIVEVERADDSVRASGVDRDLVALAHALVGAGLPVVFSSTQTPPVYAFDHPIQVVQLEATHRDAALALWRRELPEVAKVGELATRFRLPPGRIVRAVAAARAQVRDAGRAPTAADVTSAIGLGVAQQVSVLGTRVDDGQTWDDIILPADTLESVCELIGRVRHRHTVLDDWGFRDKLAKGLGVAALFHGPPGTGKTMVASLIAKELSQDLYQVDLSRMVSKWIGETEKNLAKVFDAAEGANVMLLFDEADALFSKRTEVKSSNDRHSNAEINFLLQRVERFEGVCILTTNLETSIDQAFKRRLAFRIEFPMPDEHERQRLWERMVPRAAALDPGVDFEELAHSYELAGGNIRNALLRAAFLAAGKASPITMELLQRAVKLEYRDAGKLAAKGSIYGS